MNIDNKPMPYEDFLQICHTAKDKFAFLNILGLNLTQEQWPTGDSFKDGFQLYYNGSPVSVIVEYYDMDLVIWFQKTPNEKIPYLFIDHAIFENQSGFAGCMFPRNKLSDAMHRIAEDIRLNYKQIISGDKDIWNKLIELWHSPRDKKNLP